MWSTILGFLAKPLQNWQELRQAKHSARVAAQENRARLLSDRESNNHEWEMAQLEDKDKGLRYVSFTLFVLPFIAAIFSPEHVRDYFEVSLSAIPEWWKQTYVAITGSVWGVASLKQPITSILATAISQAKSHSQPEASATAGTPQDKPQAARRSGPRSK